MEGPIEGKSLSSLNELAENPPSQLTPALRRSVRGSLVLYIAKVPGSQDVFLTTMKPRDKVVSAEDVASSLYYCHLDSAEDESLRASLQSLQVAGDTEDDDPADHGLLHPPSPLRVQATSSSNMRTGAPTSQQTEAPSLKIHRKPVGTPSSLPEAPVLVPRRPLGPRPLEHQQRHSSPIRSNDLGKENAQPYAVNPSQNLTPTMHHMDRGAVPIVVSPDEPPALPPRQNTSEWPSPGISRAGAPSPLHLQQDGGPSGFYGMGHTEQRDSSSASSESSFVTSKDFTVRIIRRDPGTGSQWNIGTLTKDLSSRKSGRKRVKIEISSGAYDKYVDETDDDDDAAAKPGFKYTPFRRHLNLGMKKSKAKRGDHATSAYAADHASHDDPSTANPNPSASPFSFTSPWHGPCGFTTGVSGRSLTCRHTFPPPDPRDLTFDPKLALLNSALVSELRLNLPMFKRTRHKHRPTLSANASRTSFFGGGGSPTRSTHHLKALTPARISHRLSRSFDGSRHGDEPDEWDETATERMDLSLGQERAGGGFGGNKAKLGKIIVEGDGMLMLDLVVMANMALWWSVASR